MKIDIGCGLNKHADCWGIDCRDLPGVDLVCDLNDPIPLPDNSVELVIASRSLPYVRNLEAVMTELYRLCVHKAVVCILAPYAHTFAHAANPQFKQKFDEYTPRYWTSTFFQPAHGTISPELHGYEAEAPLPYDFRLLRMELFYRVPYVPPLYELEELEVLKTLQANVAHEIMYHLVAVKEPVTVEELHRMSSLELPEPTHAEILRANHTAHNFFGETNNNWI